jgi:hypothetical protein
MLLLSSRQPEPDFDDDPLSKLMQPPEDETSAQRFTRLAAEVEAQKRSNAIDEEINKQRQEIKKGLKPVRVLLLGKSFHGFCVGTIDSLNGVE